MDVAVICCSNRSYHCIMLVGFVHLIYTITIGIGNKKIYISIDTFNKMNMRIKNCCLVAKLFQQF